jgi:hypothetical protein
MQYRNQWMIALLVIAGSLSSVCTRDSESVGNIDMEIAPGYLRAPYLQSLSQDSTLIAWIASDPGQPAVDYGKTPEYGQTVSARSEGIRRVAALRGLAPGTRYYYRVRAGERVLAEGPQYTFQSDTGLPTGISTFSFPVILAAAAGYRRLLKKGKPTKYCGPTAYFRDGVLLWTQVFVDGPTCTIRARASQNDELIDEVAISKTGLALNQRL